MRRIPANLLRHPVYVTKVFCIYRKLFGNRSQRTVSLTLSVKKLEHTKMACLLSWISWKKTSAKKNFIFTRKRIDGEELLLMIAEVTYS